MSVSLDRKFAKSLRSVGYGEELYDREIKEFERNILRLVAEVDHDFGNNGSRNVKLSAHDSQGEMIFKLEAGYKIEEKLYRSLPLAVALINFTDSTKYIDHIIVVLEEESDIGDTNIPDVTQKATMYINCAGSLDSALKEELAYARLIVAATS